MLQIAIIGSNREPTTACTLRRAVELCVNYVFIDLERVVQAGRIDLCALTVEVDDEFYKLSDFNSLYHRMILDKAFLGRLTPAKCVRFELLQELIRRFQIWGLGRVYSVPAKDDVNCSKIAQTMDLARFGFHVPVSLATNWPEAARDFATMYEPTIYKSLSADRSIVSLSPRVSSNRYDFLKFTPTMFQKRVGDFDVRVHAVGDAIIAEKISSVGIDYRYESHNSHEPIDVPSEIGRLVQSYMEEYKVWFAGIDFRVDDISGAWYVLEVNTMPGYSGYDHRSGGSISRALLDVMTRKVA